MKVCSKCEIKYPATAIYFGPDKRCRDGFQSQCRECCREYCRLACTTDMRKTARKRYIDTLIGNIRHRFGNMEQRCNNPNATNYGRYGGSGIKCRFTIDEFVDYIVNVLEVDPRELECHRIDPDGHYEPGNIEFITLKEHKHRHVELRRMAP